MGLPTTFVRLTGCPLRCTYCDTAYAFSGGERMGVEAILAKVASYPTRTVTVTGGEPLAQSTCHDLLAALCDDGFDVSLETSGALSIEHVDPRVSIVMDLKCPSSGEQSKNRMENLEVLRPVDQLKFVIGRREDFDWARAEVEERALSERCEVFFSPVYGDIEPAELADWILAEGLPVRFQLQLHKILWNDEPGR